jgi:CheY-like chemotaxis protein
MAAGRRTRILIVDDSAVMRSLLRSVVCADAGLEVAGTAADGASALRASRRLRPDLILLDVEMPVMDGLVTLRELRRARTQNAGDHVQFAHPARRQGDHRGAGRRRIGLCGQAGRASRAARRPSRRWRRI